MDKCCTQVWTEEGDKVVEEEANLAKAATTKNNLANKISTTVRRYKHTRWNVWKKGDSQSCRMKPTKQLCPLRILWQIRPLQGRVSKEEE